MNSLPVFYCPQIPRPHIQAAVYFVEENDADSFFLHPQQARTIEFLRKTKWKPEGEMLNDEGVI